MVGSNQLTDGWQDEGLAEYSTVMFFESNTGYGFTRTSLAFLREYSHFFLPSVSVSVTTLPLLAAVYAARRRKPYAERNG